MSDYLVPEEILTEILVKLPVKSLIRGTSVCKQWRSLIRSPSFISTHLSKSKNQNQALVARFDSHYTVIPKRGPFVLNFDSEFEFPFKCQIGFFRIVGSCDGLVCLELEPNSQRIIIWNPAIRNHVVLPQPLVNPYNESHLVVLGFGVASNAYKVVRLVYCRNLYGNGFIVPQHAEIFCLGTGRFHVGDEVFGEIMLPQEFEWVTLEMRVSLSMVGERLGAFKIDGQVGNQRCDVWMMKDYGVKESWTKLYTIDSTVRFLRAVGFRGSDEPLLTVHGCELASYNPETED